MRKSRPRKQHFEKPFSLYHLSEKCHDGETFEPRPLDKDRAMEGENWWAKRICVSSTIDGAVSALCDPMSCPYGLKLYVHAIKNLEELFAKDKIYRPSIVQVPDAEVTNEHWLKGKAVLKCIGQIEVGNVDDSVDLWYEWHGEKTKIDRFSWKWLKLTKS